MQIPIKVKKIKFGLFLLAGMLLFGNNVFGQAKSCSFWNTAVYRGRNVTCSDVITAYDPRGLLCGQANGSSTPGYYNINVYGVYDGSSFPGGANEGEAITFKINGETAAVVSGSHIWHDKGSYQCNLVVSDQPPVSDPGGPYTGSEGSAVQFNGSGSSGVTYVWNFGDGTSGAGMSPSHTYSDNGSYTVTLTVSNASSQSDEETTTATISNVNPTANAGADKSSNEGESLNFTGSATDVSSADNSAGFTWSWNFGDGSSSSSRNPSHTFTNNGSFTVTLTARDKDGGEGSDQLIVTVSNIPPQNVNAGPDQTVNEGQIVQFSGNATDPGSGDVLSYQWNFGDGSSGGGKNASHAYSDNGTYTVSLIVSDGDGSGSDNLLVTVNNVTPVANAGGPYNITTNETVQFSGSVSDPGSSDTHTFVWDLDNDGQFDDYTGRYPTRTYNNSGTYPINLKVTDKDGAWDTDATTVIVSEGVSITITAKPAGKNLKILINGELFQTPKIVHAKAGTRLTLEAPWDQYLNTTVRHHFEKWTEGGSRSKTVTIPANNVTYEAVYQEQCWVEIDTRGLNVATQGQGWHKKGGGVVVSVAFDGLASDGLTKYKFNSWHGSGAGSYSGPNRETTVHVLGPIVQKVNWDEEYYLQVFSPVGTTSGDGWYLPGTEVEISVDQETQEDAGSRNSFKSWNGEGNGSYTGNDNPATVTMNGPVTETAVWASQYKLDLVSDEGTVTGAGWYDAGSTAHVKIDTSVAATAGTRLRFQRWQGVGTGSYTGPDCEFDLVINSPVTEIAQWKTQFFLTLNSERGNPTGAGWYDKGQMISWSIEAGVQINQQERYGFFRWVGEGAGSYTGEEREPSIVIQSPISETAEWRGEFFVSTSVSPENSGTITGFEPPGGWGVADEENIFKAVGVADSGYGFFKWSGAVESYTNPLVLNLDAPKTLTAEFIKGKIRINTEPGGLLAGVDGSESVAPLVYNWPTGENHVIQVPTPQGDGLTRRYDFREWNDGGAREHNIVAPDTAITYLASFTANYFLKVESDYGTPLGSGWYVENSLAAVSVDSIVDESSRVRWKFTGWQGQGDGSLTTNIRHIDVNVQSPIVEKALWAPQFTLKIEKFPSYAPGVEIIVDPPGPWYDPGQQITLRPVINDESYSFTGWSGDVEGSDEELIITINSPLDIVANFYVPNLPPVIRTFPHIFMAEDQIFQKSFQWLSQFVQDDNDPIKYLNFEFSPKGKFEVKVDTINSVFQIIPESQWSGEGQIGIKVIDPGGMEATGVIDVSVMPVGDPPEKFALISPAKDFVFTEWSWSTVFRWQKSRNVDPGDSITYTFYFSDNESFIGPKTFAAAFIADTTLMVHIQTPGVFYWAVWAEDAEKKRTRCSEIYKISLDTDISLDENQVVDYELCQNYPNPFNPQTNIRYSIPKSGLVILKIYDIAGRLVSTLADERQSSGVHEVIWNGRDENQVPVSSGLYIIRIEAGSFIEKRKMLLVR